LGSGLDENSRQLAAVGVDVVGPLDLADQLGIEVFGGLANG